VDLIVLTKGLGRGALHLHDLLRRARDRAAFSALSAVSITDSAAGVGRGRPLSSPAATGKRRFTRKKKNSMPATRGSQSDYCLNAGKHQAQGRRSRHLLRQTIHQIRAPAGDLPQPTAPRRLHVVPDGAAAVGCGKKKLFQKSLLTDELKAVRARFSTGRSALDLLRAII